MSQQHFLSLGPDGFHRLAYTDWGEPNNPHVVICVHGLSRNSRAFDWLATALSTDVRVVCPDVVGRGESDWLQDRFAYCFPTYLSDAAALVARVTVTPPQQGQGLFADLRDRLRGRPRDPSAPELDWIGTSMGGLIGMLLAAKPGSPIRRLVLNDVGPFVPWAGLVRLKGHVGNENSFADLVEVERYFRRVCAEFGDLDDEYWRQMAEHGVAQREDGRYALRYDPAISRGMPVHMDPELPIGPEFLRGIDLWNVWEAVNCPVLVLRGADSQVLPREVVDEMRRCKPDLQVAEFAGVGHVPALATPDQIETIRAFLLRDGLT
ncbi:MAG: alpha/beta hydrolase [Rhodocyclales bacterium]|nr:alpha/beta hydrolase [Rhodocyclales bacterium]